MARCSGITRSGERCKGVAIDSSGLCYSHSPDHEEDRRRAASKGGRRGGRGRPQAELSDLKRQVRGVIGAVLAKKVPANVGAVALQGYNTLLRAERLELDIREQQELEERLAELEALLAQREAG